MQFSAAVHTAGANQVASTRSTSSTNGHRKAGASLWVVQGLLAGLFLFAGVAKLAMSADDLTAQTDLSASFLRFIGLCETLGAVGLILPGLLRIRTGLTPLAAAGLAVIMVGASVVNLDAGDPASASATFVFGLLAVLVVWARSKKVALRGGRGRGARAVVRESVADAA